MFKPWLYAQMNVTKGAPLGNDNAAGPHRPFTHGGSGGGGANESNPKKVESGVNRELKAMIRSGDLPGSTTHEAGYAEYQGIKENIAAVKATFEKMLGSKGFSKVKEGEFSHSSGLKAYVDHNEYGASLNIM